MLPCRYRVYIVAAKRGALFRLAAKLGMLQQFESRVGSEVSAFVDLCARQFCSTGQLAGFKGCIVGIVLAFRSLCSKRSFELREKFSDMSVGSKEEAVPCRDVVTWQLLGSKVGSDPWCVFVMHASGGERLGCYETLQLAVFNWSSRSSSCAGVSACSRRTLLT